MKKEEKVRLPYVPTYGEEVANTVSHAVMLPLTLCLLPFAAVWTYLHDARPVLASVSVSVCVISIFLMLLASTLYHSMRPDSKHKAVFHKLDHIFIFVAIAGTFAASAVADPAGRGPLYGRSDRLCEEGIPLPPPGLASVYRPGAVVASGGDRLFYRLIMNSLICRA